MAMVPTDALHLGNEEDAVAHPEHRVTMSSAPQDLSSNGTFLNGRKLKSAGNTDGAPRQWLSGGDRISLVMSIKPLAEQYYTYHTGERHGCADHRLWCSILSKFAPASPASPIILPKGLPKGQQLPAPLSGLIWITWWELAASSMLTRQGVRQETRDGAPTAPVTSPSSRRSPARRRRRARRSARICCHRGAASPGSATRSWASGRSCRPPATPTAHRERPQPLRN